MTCEIVHDSQSGINIFVCGRSRRQTCKFCHQGYVSKLCDFPVAKGKTCDAGMCTKCATSIAHEVDYCPTHKHQAPPPQRQIFSE
jgi:hypothetical protein